MEREAERGGAGVWPSPPRLMELRRGDSDTWSLFLVLFPGTNGVWNLLPLRAPVKVLDFTNLLPWKMKFPSSSWSLHDPVQLRSCPLICG